MGFETECCSLRAANQRSPSRLLTNRAAVFANKFRIVALQEN